jgi:hypothetical protein
MNYLDWYYFKQRVTRPLWWLRHRFVKKHKYNVIYTGLEPGYYDCDTRIFYGVFKPFEEYMEFQLSDKSHVKWWYTPEEIENELEYVPEKEKEAHRQWFIDRNTIWAELLGIYKWWKDYPNKEAACWEVGVKDPLDKEEALYKEASEKMKRIIELRNYLWD